MLVYQCPCTPLKISLPENETTVNLKSASFLVIMLLHEGLTQYSITNKALVAFWPEFHFNADWWISTVGQYKASSFPYFQSLC